MCKALEDLYQDGYAEGIVRTARQFCASDEEIIEQLMVQLSIDEARAKQFLVKWSK